eukprot:TRINITY_DN3335_c0_g1_i2.p1 TRINITY_DN3335_c0_g1~~TRINITY_DN3335_c0_g1_i2.p1  ORF type:complete len:141 (+),score=22.65 TRINITY_DN3335_c0_g1_i2:94-516(+)
MEGKALKGDVICIYPGPVYSPMAPIFFQSLKNQYILKRNDGFCIDGKNKGLSRIMYKSLCRRVNNVKHELCDESWINAPKEILRNPLNVGQFINHCIVPENSNVSYMQFTFDNEFPYDLRSYIPNVNYSLDYSPQWREKL